MKNNKSFINKLLTGLKESGRKALISLKKNPNYIPFAALIVSFLIFSLNLSYVSETTNTIALPGMGLCEFAIMLFSILSMVCVLNAYPKRQKPNYAMIVILLVFSGIIIFADVFYSMKITQRLNNSSSPVKPDAYEIYVYTMQILITHAISTAITAVCVVLEPLFAKLLKKIKTNVELEVTSVGDIELADDEE